VQKDEEKARKKIMQKYEEKSGRSEKVHASFKRSEVCLYQEK